MAALNNAIKTNYTKAKIDNTQPKSKYGFFGNKFETFNHVMQLTGTEGIRDKTGWERGMVIHWELCKRLKFDLLTNDICQNQNVLENEFYKKKNTGILRDKWIT